MYTSTTPPSDPVIILQINSTGSMSITTLLYLITIGCTGYPVLNAPVLNRTKVSGCDNIPSGNIQTDLFLPRCVLIISVVPLDLFLSINRSLRRVTIFSPNGYFMIWDDDKKYVSRNELSTKASKYEV